MEQQIITETDHRSLDVLKSTLRRNDNNTDELLRLDLQEYLTKVNELVEIAGENPDKAHMREYLLGVKTQTNLFLEKQKKRRSSFRYCNMDYT